MIRTKHAVIGTASVFLLLSMVLIGSITSQLFNMASTSQRASLITAQETGAYEVVRVSDRTDVTMTRPALLAMLERRGDSSASTPLAVAEVSTGPLSNDTDSEARISDTGFVHETGNVRVFEIADPVRGPLVISVPGEPHATGAMAQPMLDIIGVTIEGTFMTNTPSDAYDALKNTDLILGYALDGFGIYPKTDATDLDACGGHTHVVIWDGAVESIYHYHLSSNGSYVLGCFSGTPTAIE